MNIICDGRVIIILIIFDSYGENDTFDDPGAIYTTRSFEYPPLDNLHIEYESEEGI